MTVFQIILISAMGGSLLTTGAMIALDNRSKRWEAISSDQTEVMNNLVEIQNSIHQGEIDLQKNLTAPDLIAVPCSAEFIDKNGKASVERCFADSKPEKEMEHLKRNARRSRI